MKISGDEMNRKDRLKITALHEVGHYLLMKKYNKEFPKNKINILGIELFFNENEEDVNGCVYITQEPMELDSTNSNLIEALICINIAGFIAPKIFLDITYYNIEEQSDFIYADNLASIVLSRYEEKGILTSKKEIIEKNISKVRDYLFEHKGVLKNISSQLYKKQYLSPEDLKEIDIKYSL